MATNIIQTDFFVSILFNFFYLMRHLASRTRPYENDPIAVQLELMEYGPLVFAALKVDRSFKANSFLLFSNIIRFFQEYIGGGVYTASGPFEDNFHVLKVIGWGETPDGVKYWTVRYLIGVKNQFV